MTGYVVNTGSNEKYADGWDAVFGGTGKAKSPKKAAKATPGKKAAPAGKKTSKKKVAGKAAKKKATKKSRKS